MRLDLLSRWLVIAAAALVPTTAAGQAMPVVTPPTPAVPSMNVRRAAGLPTITRTAPASPKAAKGPVSGYSGGDMVLTDGRDASLYGGKQSRGVRRRFKGQVPEFHVVRKGDTMWEICDYYYGDPWGWPQLWAYNKSITNPHWIYPGDRVRLLGGQAKRRGRLSVLSTGGVRQYESGPVQLRQNAFVDPKEMKKAGKIVGSKQERKMLTSFQEIYIKGGGDFKPRAGGVYTIYRVKKPLKSKKKKKVGNIVEILGSARVKRVNSDGVATAEIISAYNAINRGDLVGPLRRTYKRLPVRPATRNLEGNIIAVFKPVKHIGSDEIVFVDRGKNHGVKRGNRFLVMRRGDGYRKLYQDYERDDKTFPEEVVAEISLLDVRDNASVALVTRSVKELRVGDKLRMRRGY